MCVLLAITGAAAAVADAQAMHMLLLSHVSNILLLLLLQVFFITKVSPGNIAVQRCSIHLLLLRGQHF